MTTNTGPNGANGQTDLEGDTKPNAIPTDYLGPNTKLADSEDTQYWPDAVEEVVVDKAEATPTPPNFTFKDVFDDVAGKESKVKDYPIPVPMTEEQADAIEIILADYKAHVYKNLDDTEAEAAYANFRQKLKVSFTGHWLKGEYDTVFSDLEHMRQQVDSEKGPIRIQGQHVGGGDTTVTGPNALMALQSTMGIGKPKKIPLWHSGITITISNFKESEILTLSHSVNEQRMELGYASQGFLFSGSDVGLVTEIVDFILAHVITCSLQEWTRGDISLLKDLILVSDIPSLLAGALDSMYPSGYPTERHCVNSGTDACDYSAGSVINISGTDFKPDTLLRFARTIWVDTNRITLAAKRHMSAPTGAHTREHVMTYQAAFNTVNPLPEPVTAGDAKIQLALRQPNLATYEELGNLWITGVLDMVNNAMAKFNNSDKATRVTRRKAYIRQYEHVLRMQRHAAWIKTIQFGVDMSENPYVVEDPKTIFDVLEGIAGDITVVEALTKDINAYREDTQISYSGLPNFKCPSCGESQTSGKDFRHGIIPMDLVSYFFTLTGYQLIRLGSQLIQLEK